MFTSGMEVHDGFDVPSSRQVSGVRGEGRTSSGLLKLTPRAALNKLWKRRARLVASWMSTHATGSLQFLLWVGVRVRVRVEAVVQIRTPPPLSCPVPLPGT